MKNSLNQLIGIFLLIEVIAQLTSIAVLGSQFEFPDILRQPASVALLLFHQQQSFIVPSYYLFMFSSILYLPITALVKTKALSTGRDSLWINLFQLAGIATVIFQVIGFCRWLILMPFLSDSYFNQSTSEASKKTIELIYETMNHYAGITIGEHLGFIAMGCWTIAFTKVITFGKWWKASGQFIGALLVLAAVEPFGGDYATLFGALNFFANTLWSFWLIAIGILFLRSKS